VNCSSALVAPFPYFGGKRRAAQTIWDALGDPGGYVEPFCGSAAALLARPPFKGRRVETINDTDGWLVNTWRAIQLSPADVAAYAAGPVIEIDYHARLAWLQERRTPDLVAWLEGHPEAHDAKAAGWWLYVMACGIGDPWGGGPWRVHDGRLQNIRELPHLGDAGQGVNRKLPHLGDAGKGVNRELQSITLYMHTLSARLQRVRITCGDWKRVLQPSVIRSTATKPSIGVLLDPPYTTSPDLYPQTDTGTHHTLIDDIQTWCAQNGALYRIVLCGYDTDHDTLIDHGWRKQPGRAGGGAGYNTDPKAGRREQLWTSPPCLYTPTLFDKETPDGN
jgi:hypothetical protein